MIKKTARFLKKNYFLASTVLIFLSFPSYDIFFLKLFPLFAWFCLVPLFVFLRGRGYRDIFFYSSAAGLLGYYFAFHWIGYFGAAVPGGYWVILVFLIPCLVMFFAAKITLAEFISRRFPAVRFLIYPSVWIFFDWLQSIGYLAYPEIYWGYSQYPFTAFIQSASFVGIMGITFMIICSNCIFADVLFEYMKTRPTFPELVRTRPARVTAVFLVLVAAITIYGGVVLVRNDRPVKRDMRLSLVQSCISPWEDWIEKRSMYLRELKLYTEKSLPYDPDFIIWSESATLETISYGYETGNLNQFQTELMDHIRTWGKPLLTGEIGISEQPGAMLFSRRPQNNAVLINQQGDVLQTYSKINLVPFGEWFPYENTFPLVKRITESMGASDFVPGDRPVLFELNGTPFAVLVCYEGIFFRLCREYKNMGARYFVNITNDGWTDTYSGHMQHFASSKFRAIENGIWFVRAGNTGFTTIIDPYGRIVQSIPILKKGFLVGNIDYSFNHETVYQKLGDLFLYMACAFIAVLLIMMGVERLTLVRTKPGRGWTAPGQSG